MMDEIEQSLVLRQGLPTEWEIFLETGETIFDFKQETSQAYYSRKNERKETDEISQHEEDIDIIIDCDAKPSNNQHQIIQDLHEILPDLPELQDKKEIENTTLESPLQNQTQEDEAIRRKKILFNKLKKKGKNSSKRRNRGRFETTTETKNIPKNYGKQIIKFIKKEKALTQRILKGIHSNYSYDQLNYELKKKKKTMNKISDLRKVWVGYQYSKEFRILTSIFLRKYCLSWIFNSRIQNIKYPIKYRYRIMEGVKRPQQFLYIKDF